MIKIKKADKYNNCCCCHSDKNIKLLSFTSKINFSSSLYLCNNCLKELLEVTLNELLELKKNEED